MVNISRPGTAGNLGEGATGAGRPARWARRFWRGSGFKALWTAHRFRRLRQQWRDLVPVHDAPPAARFAASRRARVLLIPPDPLLLIASRGDEAMLLALMASCRDLFHEPEFVIATAGDEADRWALRLGARPCRALDDGFCLRRSLDAVSAFEVTHCVTIGADVCDGSYDPVFSARLLLLADLVLRGGARGVVNGFSFSERAYPGLASVFAGLSRALVLNLRDPVSHRRFVAFSGVPAELTADIAFLLDAQSAREARIEPLAAWVRSRRAQGDIVVGFNIHPLLVELDQRHRLPALVAEVGAALTEFLDSAPVSLVLLEHDFRGASADRNCVDPLLACLRRNGHADRVHRPAEPMGAVELKASVAHLDGVASGRMHLAIAALGMGVPVLAFGYKGKMEGLLAHFGLDPALAIPGAELFDRAMLVTHLRSFVGELDRIRAQVDAGLPGVRDLARRNLMSFR